MQVSVIEQSFKENAPVRVAAYCRVSTNMETQKMSLETQVEAYKRVIREHPGWVLAGIYQDRGLSGTMVRHRAEFLRMIKDARAGKIDYIIAKSISRFSRNTVDTLAYVRELKNLGVSVYFEKEHLDTGTLTSELILSILAAAAQEEIMSLSNNMKVGRRMKAEAGIIQWTRIFGYRRKVDRISKTETWEIIEPEAAVIRRIYEEAIDGKSLTQICQGLEEEGIPTASGTGHWSPTPLSKILHNEKYVGDVLFQKYYIVDPIQHVQVRNDQAKVKQYYIRNHHPAIISRNTAEMASMVMALKDYHSGTSQYPFYGFLKCPYCGANMVKTPTPRKTSWMVWTCGGTGEGRQKRKERTQCPPYGIPDAVIRKTISKMIPEEELTFRKLHEQVSAIYFQNWEKMVISWRNKRKKSVLPILYQDWREHPFPSIEEKENCTIQVWGRTVKGKSYLINGEQVKCAVPEKEADSIRHMREAIQNTIIEGRQPVPAVYGYGTTCKTKAQKGKR